MPMGRMFFRVVFEVHVTAQLFITFKCLQKLQIIWYSKGIYLYCVMLWNTQLQMLLPLLEYKEAAHLGSWFHFSCEKFIPWQMLLQSSAVLICALTWAHGMVYGREIQTSCDQMGWLHGLCWGVRRLWREWITQEWAKTELREDWDKGKHRIRSEIKI